MKYLKQTKKWIKACCEQINSKILQCIESILVASLLWCSCLLCCSFIYGIYCSVWFNESLLFQRLAFCKTFCKIFVGFPRYLRFVSILFGWVSDKLWDSECDLCGISIEWFLLIQADTKLMKQLRIYRQHSNTQ